MACGDVPQGLPIGGWQPFTICAEPTALSVLEEILAEFDRTIEIFKCTLSSGDLVHAIKECRSIVSGRADKLRPACLPDLAQHRNAVAQAMTDNRMDRVANSLGVDSPCCPVPLPETLKATIEAGSRTHLLKDGFALCDAACLHDEFTANYADVTCKECQRLVL